MTTIDPRLSLLAALQPRPQVRAHASAATAAAAAAGGARASSQLVAQHLAAIDRADPDRRRKAVRVVLQAQLAREFGAAVLNDPGFSGMLEAVQAQMDGDAQSAAAVQALGDWLLAGAA